MLAADFLERSRRLVDDALDRLLPAEADEPTTLHRAMRYSVFAGGKRLRPALALAAARLGSLDGEATAGAAAALELIHTYSLIHDDLPAMDDDRLRRGKPTCHVAFGEGHAILAGDALLTLAFEVLAVEPAGDALAGRRLEAVRRVSRAAGPAGMVGGQTMDLEAADPAGGDRLRPPVEQLHRRKTGALIAASVALGGILAGLDRTAVDELERAALLLGLAFQVADDILDVEGTAGALGKTAGKDARAGKLTYPAVYGIERSRLEAARLVDEADAALGRFGAGADALRALGRFMVERKS